MLEFDPEKNPYKIVYCDIVHRCNMECANCYLPNREYSDIDRKSVIDFIKKFKNPVDFRFIGGEPTLHKDLPEIIKDTTSLGHRATLVTNGLRISNQEYLQTLKEAGLSTVYLSMTGFDDDSIYKVTDLMSCAEKKMAALNNCLKLKLRVAVGCIVVKNLNEHVLDKLYDYIQKKEAKSIISLEFRNIGQVGRYLKDKSENYQFDELKSIVFDKFKITEPKKIFEDNQYSFSFRAYGKKINITNWQGVADGFNDDTNQLRGRMTETFKVSPFLSHVKENENGY